MTPTRPLPALSWFATGALLALAACASPLTVETPTVPLDEPFQLGVGEQAAVRGTSLRLRFLGVTADSRCPIDAICVWQGDAALQFTLLQPDSADRTLELHTTLDPRTSPVGAYTLTLERLEPAPSSQAPVPPADYLATVRVAPR